MLAAAACLAVAAILWFAAPDPRPARPLAIDPQLHQQWLALTLQAGEARAAAGDQLATAAALPTEVFATLDRTTAQLTQGAAAEIDALTMDLRSSFDFLLQPIAPWTGPRDDDTPTNPAPETEMPSDRPV